MATEATGAQPLQLDITANSELFSLSVDLQPLRTAEQVAALQLALRPVSYTHLTLPTT